VEMPKGKLKTILISKPIFSTGAMIAEILLGG
jgi:hypothetical protein